MTSIGLLEATEWKRILETPDATLESRLKAIYGPDPSVAEGRRALLETAVATFIDRYGGNRQVLISRAPGRINLLGNHIDHRGGYLNFMAIDRDTLMVASPNSDDTVRACNSLESRFEPFEFRIGELLPVEKRGQWHSYIEEIDIPPRIWQNYVQAAILYLQDQTDRELTGMDVCVHGDVPIAAGLSSSSTLVVSAFQACCAFNQIDITRDAQAEFCGAAEWYAGTRGGSGDHAAMLYSRRQTILQLRFFPLTTTEVPFPEGYRVFACNSLVEHAPPGIFNERVATYEIGLMMLRKTHPTSLAEVEHLRDLVPDGRAATLEFYEMLKGLPERATRDEILGTLAGEEDRLSTLFAPHSEPEGGYRIRQVMLYGVAECARSARGANLLSAGKVEAFGDLKRLSHDGDRRVRISPDGTPSPVDNRVTQETIDRLISTEAEIYAQPGGYDCSCEELDHLVDLAQSVGGVVGAGLTGGGLGGCVLVLVKEDSVDELIDVLKNRFYDARGLESDMLVCSSVEGAGIL